MSESAARDRHPHKCPPWCQLEHKAAQALSHESETFRLMMTRPREGQVEFLKVRTAEYIQMDVADSVDVWGPMVEIEHHIGDRYRVLNLTAENARDLAILLLNAAARAEESEPRNLSGRQ